MTESGLAIQTMEQAQALAKTLSPSALIPDSLRGKPGDVLIVLLTGAELGLGPMQSLRGISVIKGKATMSADLMLALVKKSEACEYLVMSEYLPERVTFKTKRRGDPAETVVSFSKADAERAGLWGNNTWKAYPQAMLKARAASAICRAVYPDVCMGIYDETEAVADFRAPIAALPPAVVQALPVPSPEPSPAEQEEIKAAEAAPEHDAVTGEVVPPEDFGAQGEDIMFEVYAKRIRESGSRAKANMVLLKDAPLALRPRLVKVMQESFR